MTYTNLSLAEPSQPTTLTIPSASGLHKSTPVAVQAPITSPKPTHKSADETSAPDETPIRVSMRNRKPRDFLTPKMKGKAYSVFTHTPRKQRVPVTWHYPEKQRVTYLDIRKDRHHRAHGPGNIPTAFRSLYDRYKQRQRHLRNLRVGW